MAVVLIEENEDQSVTTIRLNRPEKKNAINSEMLAGIHDAIDKVAVSKSRVVIITGTDDFFSAGIDLNVLKSGGLKPLGKEDIDKSIPSIRRYYSADFPQFVYSKMELLEKPVIAKISGFCFGLAFELALACDFRYCLESTIFNMTETKLGIIPDVGGITRLTQLVGKSRAKDIILRGRRFDGNEAYRMGVVNGVAKNKEELEAIVKECAEDLIDSAPLAVALGKKLINFADGRSVEHGLDLELLAQSWLMETKDKQIGTQARINKEKPQWKGK